MTPTPAGRCPFEAFHVYPELEAEQRRQTTEPPPRPLDHASYTATELVRLLRQAHGEAEPRALEIVLYDCLTAAVELENKLAILANDK